MWQALSCPPADSKLRRTKRLVMKVLTFGRTFAVPVSALVLGLAALSAPPLAMPSILLPGGIAAIGFSVLAVTRRWRRSRSVRPLTRTENAVQIATEKSRMDSDAG